MLINQPFIKRTSTYFLNKYVLSIIITIVIIFFGPDYFNKYKIDLESRGTHVNSNIYFQDLDSDGNSEKIVYYHNNLGKACYMIFSNDGSLIDQYNYSLEIADSKRKDLWFHDADKNNLLEIYSLTRSQDSLFLNIHEPLKENGINKRGIFIDTISAFEGIWDIMTPRKSFLVFDSSEAPSFLFNLGSGRSGAPRNVYKYRFQNNDVIKSKHVTNNASIETLIDLDGDNKKEILLNVHASGNKIDSIYSNKSDYYTWLTILKEDLNYMMEPIEFKSKFSAISTNTILVNKTPHILALQRERSGTNNFIIYNNRGEVERRVPVYSGKSKLLKDTTNGHFYLQLINKGKLVEYATDLQEINSYTIPTNADVFWVHLNNQISREWIAIPWGGNELCLYSNDFKYKTTFTLPSSTYNSGHLGNYLVDSKNYFYLSNGDTYVVLKYGSNPLYYYQYLIYLGIFLGILMLLSLAIKGQKIQEVKKRRIEEQIADLQLKTIKNQVDPHFVFNAINTISEMTLMENKLEADQFICEFSDLMRKTLDRSDRIATTIEDEIAYVTNYLRLQQIRLSKSFEYIITISENIKQTQLIPKHTIYSYVENAVKYGIQNKNKKPLIAIDVSQVDRQLIITVSDNGGGLRDQKKSSISTGNGIRIMAAIFDLYTKRFKTKIAHSLGNYSNSKGEVIGVKAEVKIKLSKSD